eukprot:s134_g5.t1
MMDPPALHRRTPFGIAMLHLPEHIRDALLDLDILPTQTEGELFLQLCLEQVPPNNPDGFDGQAWINFVVQSSVDPTNPLERTSKYVAVTDWMHTFVQKCLDKLPQWTQAERDQIQDTCFTLFTAAVRGQDSSFMCDFHQQQEALDRANWRAYHRKPPEIIKAVAQWRHWKPRHLKEESETTQRKLEQHLRAKWADRVIGLLAPHAHAIPFMQAVGDANQDQEFLDLLGDTRFRTVRIHCLCLEGLQRLGFTHVPWQEKDVRTLLNTLREQEVTPHKLQSIWNTLKWFSAKFGMLDPESIERLKLKRKTIQENLVETVIKPQRKAQLPSKEVILALERVAGGKPTAAAGAGKPSPKQLMDQYICAMARFQVACSARFNDLQHTSPKGYRLNDKTLELSAWQTKTVSAFRIKKNPVPLIAPLYSFSGESWWTVLTQSWDRLVVHPKFQDMDYLIPTVSSDFTGFISRPSQADRALRWLKDALHRGGDVEQDQIKNLSWHSFRVFIPDCAYQLGMPRDQRQYLGNWSAENTADIYTREKRKVVQRTWTAVADRMGSLDLRGQKSVPIDLDHQHWQPDVLDLEWEVPEQYQGDINKLHQQVQTIFQAKEIPYFVMAQMAQDGYTSVEDLADRWPTITEARQDSARDLTFRHTDRNGILTQAQSQLIAVGWIASKYIISALPDVDERPIKTSKKTTVDGWEKEEEEEVRKPPSTRRQLEHMHTVFRNNLMMAILLFPSMPKLNATHRDLEDWYRWFWGRDIADRKPQPSEQVLLYAERNAWREIHNLVFGGMGLREAMQQIKGDTLFWTREVYESVARHSGCLTNKSILLLYAGKADPDSLDAVLISQQPGLASTIFALDIKRPAEDQPQDIMDDTLYSDLCNHAAGGHWKFVGGGPNCRTWSILRWFPKPGAPVPVRGRHGDEIWGLPGNSLADQLDTDRDSLLLLRQMVITDLAYQNNPAGVASFLEHPQDPLECSTSPMAPQCSSFWATDLYAHWAPRVGHHKIDFDQCRLGQVAPLRPVSADTLLSQQLQELARTQVPAVSASVHDGERKHPLSKQVLQSARHLIARAVNLPIPEADLVEEGQPFHLNLISALAKHLGDVDSAYPLLVRHGVPLGVTQPTWTTPGVWPTKEELKGDELGYEDLPQPSGRDNYTSAKEFATQVRTTFVEEEALGMVEGPFTQQEAADRCSCTPEELCPGPLAAIDEGDKVRTIYDGSWGKANAHIQQNTAEKTTAPTIMDCVQAIHWLTVAQQGPSPPVAPGTEGGWSPPEATATWSILKADVTKAHRRIKIKPEGWKYQVAQLEGEWWINKVGTYGMASAQLYWGRMAALLLRLCYLMFPHIDWGFVFVDDFCWLLRTTTAPWDMTLLLMFLLALGCPLSWHKTCLSEVNTWLGFQVNPRGPVVDFPPDKKTVLEALLHRLMDGQTFTAKEIERALGRLNWATSAWPLSRPFLQPFWAWKSATTTSGRPNQLIRSFAKLLLHLLHHPQIQPCPYDPPSIWWGASDASASPSGEVYIGGWIAATENPTKEDTWWFQYKLPLKDHPWAHKDGDPTRRIAALEMFGTLILTFLLIQKGGRSLLRTRLSLISDNQGNVFALLNQKTKQMPTSAFLMQLIVLLHRAGVQIAPSHMKRDYNQWADELTHPVFTGFKAHSLLPKVTKDMEQELLADGESTETTGVASQDVLGEDRPADLAGESLESATDWEAPTARKDFGLLTYLTYLIYLMSDRFRHMRLPCVSALLALGTGTSQGSNASHPSHANGVPRVFTFADQFHPMLCHLARTVEVSGGILHVMGLRDGGKAVTLFKDAAAKKPKEGNPWHTKDKFTMLKKHLFLHRVIRRLPANDTIIFVDAFDVLFQRPFNDLIRKYHELAQAHLEKHGHWPVIYGGELNCWPFPHHNLIRVPPRAGANRSWVHQIPARAALSDGHYHKTWRYPGATGEIYGDQVCQEWLAEKSTADALEKRPRVGSVGFGFRSGRKKLKRMRFPFLCSGTFIGKVSSLRRLLREMFLLFQRTAETCDQALIPLLLLRFPYLGFVDKDAQLFLSLHGHDGDDLEILERPLCQGNYFAARNRNSSKRNFQHFLAPRLLGRRGFDIPKLLHFNGNGKRHMSRCVKEFLDVGLLKDPMECRYVDFDRNVLQDTSSVKRSCPSVDGFEVDASGSRRRYA